MKAALFYGGADIRVEDVPEPVPGAGEVMIKVGAAGICGSDLHAYRGETRFSASHPYMSGHELAGEVVALGPEVHGIQLGDRVVVEPLHLMGCGVCRWCSEGHREVCPERGVLHGERRMSRAFAEFDVAPEHMCHPITGDLSFEEASILDVYACVVHVLKRVPAEPFHKVVIVGGGPMGLAAAEAYKAVGARRVIVVDVLEHALNTATKLGADAVVNAAENDVVEAVRALTHGEGADIVIDAVGGRAPTFENDVRMLARNGRLGVLGIFTTPQDVDAAQAMRKQIQIVWINSYGVWGGIPAIRIAMDMVHSGDFRPSQLISHRVALSDIARGFALAADRAASQASKVIVLP